MVKSEIAQGSNDLGRSFFKDMGALILVIRETQWDTEFFGCSIKIYTDMAWQWHQGDYGLYIYITDWWFGAFGLFFHTIWDVILSIDFHIFHRGSNHQPDTDIMTSEQ